jgi:hypothetical protein
MRRDNVRADKLPDLEEALKTNEPLNLEYCCTNNKIKTLLRQTYGCATSVKIREIRAKVFLESAVQSSFSGKFKIFY